MQNAEQIAVGLQRQHEERLGGRTRVGMAFGPASPLFRAAEAWAHQSGRRVATYRGGGLLAAIVAVGSALALGKDAKDAALRFVFPGHSEADIPPWDGVSIAQRISIVAAACPPGDKREVLEQLLYQTNQPLEFWTEGALSALIEIRGEEALPLLFGWLESFDQTSVNWVADLVQLVPSLPFLIATPATGRKTLDIAAKSGDRSCVLLHEGVIYTSEEGQPSQGAPDEIIAAGEDRSRNIVASDRPDAIELHDQALAEVKTGRVSPIGQFDSAAEAFLAQMLEAHPLTARLFEPQGKPGFAMQGGPPARVDFLAPGLRIAIEVDGPYHFDPIQYRRDRHKDLELQSRGYLVLRFLAEDVVADFERVRATINRVVLAQTPS